MKNIYRFPAIFEYADDGINISFPDLEDCFTCANSTEEALEMAEEVLRLVLKGREEDNEPIPEPSSLEKIVLKSNQKTVMVTAYMTLARMEIDSKAIKKTLTIPNWLNKLAEEKKVNYSQILQAALKEHLGIKER